MPNPYFQFKQFTIYHDKCAMKVGTDGVLLGAWSSVAEAQSALDIGAGSGLISLMLAQRNNKLIVDAIDINDNAVKQAEENAKSSPFCDRIYCYKTSLQEFCYTTDKRYDAIISNPPFFAKSLKSPEVARSIARHTDTLSAEELIQSAANLLTEKGKLSVIYPFEYKESLFDLAKQYRLFVSRVTNIYPTPHSQPKRILMELSKEEKDLTERDLIIEIERHVYSDEFKDLVKDFYLNL